jgi:3-oxoacyl-[acyl-carrier-protein] synthase-1
MRKVVVTGVGLATCLGREIDPVVERLKELRHGIVAYPPFASPDIPVKVAAPVEDFEIVGTDPEDWIFPREIRFRMEQYRCLSPHLLYATYAMHKAIEDAGLSAEEVSNPETGMFTASAGSAMMTWFHMDRLKRLGPSRCMPMGMIASIAGTLSFNLVARHQIQGSTTGFVSACASSGHALGYAFDEIASGRQDRMFVVGAEDFTEETIVPFGIMRVMSKATDPNRASRPFDRQRDGFVGTGGATVLVLESEKVAATRGAKRYAEVRGWGQSTDGHHVAISHPEGAGLARAMQIALKSADVSPDEIDYINAHATSTPIGDIAECKAIKTVFGAQPKPWISSTKALTGHGLSLSSVMEAAFCAFAIDRGFIPGQAHLEELDECADGLRLPTESLDEAPKLVMTNSSGFGGANVSVVLSA